MLPRVVFLPLLSLLILMKRPSVRVRGVVQGRDGGCFVCGAPANNLHHRLARGAGGSKLAFVNAPANLLLLCGSGTSGCHGWVESHRLVAYELGLLVRRNGVLLPAEVPVFSRWRGCWFLLDDAGGLTRAVPNV